MDKQVANGKPRNNRRGKGRRSRKENELTTEKEVRSKEGLLPKGDRDNDPNWYFTNKDLAEQASQLSFQSMLGFGTVIGSYQVSTVAVVHMNACPGGTWTHNDNGSWNFYSPNGINLAAQKIYTLLASHSGRVSVYGPQDIAIMILAMSSTAELIEHLRRAFGLAMTYNPRNRAYPATILDAMGFDDEDLFKNMANYRLRFNTIITRVNQLPILSNIAYFRKSMELYQKVYVDDISSMAQTYVCIPETIWQLDETSYQGGSILKTMEVYSHVADKTVAQLLDLLESNVTQLLNSSTLNIVYADLINLANKMNLEFAKFDYLLEGYQVIPEYDRNFLLQIHNATIVGTPNIEEFVESPSSPTGDTVFFTPSNDVYTLADQNIVAYNPGFTLNRKTVGVGHDTLVDMDTDNPSVVDRIEALRFTAIWLGDSFSSAGGTVSATDWALPDHYIVEIAMHTNVGNSDPQGSRVIDSISWNAEAASEKPSAQFMANVTKFNKFPLLYKVDNTGKITHVVGDLNFYTSIDFFYLERLNRLMYTGLFEFRV